MKSPFSAIHLIYPDGTREQVQSIGYGIMEESIRAGEQLGIYCPRSTTARQSPPIQDTGFCSNCGQQVPAPFALKNPHTAASGFIFFRMNSVHIAVLQCQILTPQIGG